MAHSSGEEGDAKRSRFARERTSPLRTPHQAHETFREYSGTYANRDGVDSRRGDSHRVRSHKRARESDRAFAPFSHQASGARRRHDYGGDSRSNLRLFFEEHKDEEWFRDKYHPLRIEEQMKERAVVTQHRASLFNSEYISGLVVFPDLEAPARTSEVSDSNKREVTTDDAVPKAGAENVRASDEGEGKTDAPVSVEAAETKELPDTPVLFIRNVPVSWTRGELMSALQEGAPVQALSISDPKPGYQHELSRVAWAVFESAALAQQCKEKCNGMKIRDRPLQLDFHHHTLSRTNIAPAIASQCDVMSTHVTAAKDAIIALDKKYGVPANEMLIDASFCSLPVSAQLNQLLYYLRRVHLVCFYCGTGFGDAAEMQRRCAVHLRAPIVADQADTKERAHEQFLNAQRTRMQSWIQRELDAIDRREKAENYEIEQSLVERQDIERYKCGLCPKVFKGPEFVVKHVRTRHEGDEQLEKVQTTAVTKLFFDNYRDDPRHITAVQPLRPRTPPRHMRPTPRSHPSVRSDPRGVRDYRDLDAPMEDPPVLIDFHALDYSTPPGKK